MKSIMIFLVGFLVGILITGLVAVNVFDMVRIVIEHSGCMRIKPCITLRAITEIMFGETVGGVFYHLYKFFQVDWWYQYVAKYITNPGRLAATAWFLK